MQLLVMMVFILSCSKERSMECVNVSPKVDEMWIVKYTAKITFHNNEHVNVKLSMALLI